MFLEGSCGIDPPSGSLHRLTSMRDVGYREWLLDVDQLDCCGSCGYSLNLSSSHRNTANIGTKYRKIIKKGFVSFYSIDESRFSHIDELSCLPYFNSTRSWGLFRHRTKLQCRRCGNFVGIVYEEVSPSPSSSLGSDVSDSSSIGNSKKYNIKISSLQPTSEESGTPLIVR